MDAAPTAATALQEGVRRRWSASAVHTLAAAMAAFRGGCCSHCSHSTPREGVQEMGSLSSLCPGCSHSSFQRWTLLPRQQQQSQRLCAEVASLSSPCPGCSYSSFRGGPCSPCSCVQEMVSPSSPRPDCSHSSFSTPRGSVQEMVSLSSPCLACSHSSFQRQMLLPLQPQHSQRECAGDGQPW